MDLALISPVVLTWNEAPNIERCLTQLAWANDVLVIDSGSTDGTIEICSRFPNVRVLVRPFDFHSAQWNYGLEQVKTDWVLALDADFVISEELPGEIENLSLTEGYDGYVSAFRYLVQGTALYGCLYPPRTILFKKSSCRYVQDGHTQLLTGDRSTGQLSCRVDHDDRKPLSRWLGSQLKYAYLEAEKLATLSPSEVGFADKLRLMIWPAPIATVVYTLFGKGVLFNGWKGIYYTLQRTYAELLLSLLLLEHKIDISSRSLNSHQDS